MVLRVGRRVCTFPAMEPNAARPKAATKTGKTAPAPAAGVIATNVRFPAALIARLDAATERRSATLAKLGGTTSRNATIVAALEDWCSRDEAAAGAKAST